MRTKKIRETRIRLGYSQKDLADRIGVTRQTINLIEAGKYNPSLRICRGISKKLNSTLDELFGE